MGNTESMQQLNHEKTELEEFLGTSISSLAGLCSEQVLLRIYVIGIDTGRSIERQRNSRVLNEALRGTAG